MVTSNPPYFLRGLALLAPVVALTLAASEAEAVPVSCTGWGTTMTWQGPAYGLTSARLYRVDATGNVLVETSDDEVLWTVAGTQPIGAEWNSVPLDGTFFAVIDAVFYGGLGHSPTAEELLAWPTTRTYRLTETTPRFTCVAPPPPPSVCGDGAVNQASEQCDDGNLVDGDGCSVVCAIEAPLPVCGDASVNVESEQCDDGNLVDGDGCSSSCTTEAPPAFCGDGWANQPTEECDDGNASDGDGCSANCTVEALSGCTRTIGYWGTHHATARNRSQRIAWPISEGTALCGSTWLTTINATPRGDAFVILARQWIGARLNGAAGAGMGPDLIDGIARAAELLSDCSISSAERSEALDVASLLDGYNNGLVGPGHCD